MSQGKKIPEGIWERFLDLLAENTTSVSATCNALGITTRSYYNRRYIDPEFGKKVDYIFDQIRRPVAEDALAALIVEKNLGAIKYFLMYRGGDRWSILPNSSGKAKKKEEEKPKMVVQKVPRLDQMISAQAYLKIMDEDWDLENLPATYTITLNLEGLRRKMQDKNYVRRMIEENKEYYGSME